MANISYQRPPRIPPIGFFEPITVDPNDMMTDVEFLLGMLKKLNETIKQVNSNTKFIEDYDGQIQKIEAEVAKLTADVNKFKEDIEDELDAFRAEILTTINTRFNQIVVELNSMIATTLVQANAYTDSVSARLEQEIADISVGQITVYDPTTGVLSPLQVVIDNLYGASRDDALTATEYDALDLTATAYDAYQVTAFNYDQSGKVILV